MGKCVSHEISISRGDAERIHADSERAAREVELQCFAIAVNLDLDDVGDIAAGGGRAQIPPFLHARVIVSQNMIARLDAGLAGLGAR